MKKRTRLIAGVMAMMLTLGGCGSAANTANKKEATQTTAEQTASSQEDTAEAAAKETELDDFENWSCCFADTVRSGQIHRYCQH